MKKTRVTWALLALCIGLAALIVRLQAVMARYQVIHFVDERPVYLPKGDVLKWASLGHRGLVADWLWIQCVLYYGRRVMDGDNPYYVYAKEKGTLEKELSELPEHEKGFGGTDAVPQALGHILYQPENPGLVSSVYPLLDRVTTVEPGFVFPYIFGGVYVLLGTGDVGESLRLLEKGTRMNPERWELPFYLGWVCWMYKGEKEKTAQYLREAVAKENCPAYVGELLFNLSRDLGVADFTRQYLAGILESTDNPKIRDQVRELLDRYE